MSIWSKTSVKKGQKCSYSQVCTSPDSVSTAEVVLNYDIKVLPELNQLTGIAAILTFPLDVEVVEAEEREAKEEEERKKAEAAHEAEQ